MSRPLPYGAVSTPRLRHILRLLERSRLPFVRVWCLEIRCELLSRACEADAELTSWVQQPRAEA